MFAGGITIAFLKQVANERPKIVNLKPFCLKDLKTRSLGDSIKDLNDCVYLYPNIPKEQAFRKYYTQQNNTSRDDNGYVQSPASIK